MTRALLDVNVWLALVDPDHEAHERVHAWLEQWLTRPDPDGWASCAITQNGFARIISSSAYPNAVSPRRAVELLVTATSAREHEFWPCDVQLGDVVDVTHLVGPRQITDAYLLALAVARDGTLVTLDRSIPLRLVRGARERHLTSL